MGHVREPGSVAVAVVEDHVLVRDGVVQALSSRPQFDLAYCGDSLAEVLALESAPDLVILDLDLNGKPANAADARLLIERGSVVLVVSACGVPSQIRDMVRAGVHGFVPKQEPVFTMFEAIDAVLAGEPWTPSELAAILANDVSDDRPILTEQEQRVLVLYSSGLKLASVARRLDISPHTAKEHIDRIRDKYEEMGSRPKTKTDLYREAVRAGLVDP